MTASTTTATTATTTTEAVARAARRVDDREQTVAQVEKERGRLRWFLILAVVVVGPAWFAAGAQTAAVVVGVFLLFFVVGLYLNVMHIKNARQELDAARIELERQQMRASS